MRAGTLLLALLALSGTCWASSDVLCQTYVVQSGDSLWGIANKFGVQQDDLTAALQQCIGYTTGATLSIGQKICLPGYIPACDYVVDSGSVANCKAYQVQQGDTIALIAATFGIYAPDLASLNSDVAGVLQPGVFLRLPPWDDSTCPDPDSDAASCRVYNVQQGDFVFGIASIFRVSVNDLLAANSGLTTTTYLQAGQRIRIPPFPSTCGNGVLATPPTTGVFGCRAYKVKTGDSLSAIALLFETTIASLVAVNPELSNPSLLTPGKIIRIPPYPAECVNGILIDPTGTTAATPASPSTTFSPSPSTTASPSPAPVVASPSPVVPSPTPSPSPVVASPSPSPSPVVSSPSPSPAPTTPTPTTAPPTTTTAGAVTPKATTASSSGSSSNVGAIVGGVVGGVGGTLLLAGVTYLIIRKRRAAAAAAGGAYGGVTANVTTAGGGLAVKTRAARLAEDTGYSTSPRNGVTPRTRAMANVA